LFPKCTKEKRETRIEEETYEFEENNSKRKKQSPVTIMDPKLEPPIGGGPGKGL